VFYRHRRGRRARAAYGDVVVEHPHFDTSAGQAVIPVRDRVDQGLLPGERWVLEALAKEKIVQDRALANMLFDPADGFVNQTH
jgi:hypothetical protein